jgi:hypothetical protein
MVTKIVFKTNIFAKTLSASIDRSNISFFHKCAVYVGSHESMPDLFIPYF